MGNKQTETHLKGQIKDYLNLKRIFNYHLLQGLGAYKGVPDRVMHFKGEVYYLEIKKPKGIMSPYQLAFQEQCVQDGIHYHIIKSLEDLIDIVG